MSGRSPKRRSRLGGEGRAAEPEPVEGAAVTRKLCERAALYFKEVWLTPWIFFVFDNIEDASDIFIARLVQKNPE